MTSLHLQPVTNIDTTTFKISD